MVFVPCSLAYQKFQWFFCFLFLPKTFVLMFSFCSQKVRHEHYINIARRLNMKTLTFDSVYLIDQLWDSFKFLFLHIITRIRNMKGLQNLSSVESYQVVTLHSFFVRARWKFQKPWGTFYVFDQIYNNRSLIKNIILKLGPSPSKKIAFTCFNKKPVKKMKIAFYFMLIVLFVLKIFRFLSWHFWSCKKWLDEKT